MTWQVKGDLRRASDSHARYHSGDWLDVIDEDWLPSTAPVDDEEYHVMLCRCSCGNAVYVHSDEVRRRREAK